MFVFIYSIELYEGWSSPFFLFANIHLLEAAAYNQIVQELLCPIVPHWTPKNLI